MLRNDRTGPVKRPGRSQEQSDPSTQQKSPTMSSVSGGEVISLAALRCFSDRPACSCRNPRDCPIYPPLTFHQPYCTGEYGDSGAWHPHCVTGAA